MENATPHDDATAIGDRSRTPDQAAAAASGSPPESSIDARPAVDWLRVFAVVVITIAAVFMLVRALTYRDEVASWLRANSVRPEVKIFLSVAPTYASEGEATRGILKLDVAGRVTVFGEPLENGVVQIVVEDVISQYYLGGDTGEVKAGQGFEKSLVLSPDSRGFRSSSVNVRVTVTGVHRGTPVTGDAELNIGFPRSFRHWVAWLIAALATLTALVMICLFTGNIHAKKQRGLYATMYFLVFASLALPILVSMLILQSSYLISIMEKAPVGLVRATAASSKSEAQWFINIGGIVTQRDETSTSPRSQRDPRAAPRSEPEIRTAAPPEAEGGTKPAAKAGTDAKGAAAATANAEAARDSRSNGALNPLEISTSSRNSPYIEGGLAVPFYVVLLAMFGAGINLTRRVPEIQEEFRDSVRHSRPFPSWLHKPTPEPEPADDEQRRRTFAFRRALIQSFMYLLSAPFLAMAVYYLLQIVANEPARPVLVLVAFATGLIADTLINRIIRFAEETLRLAPADKARAAIESANAQIDKINAIVREEQAKLAESIFLAEVSRVHDGIRAARADPAKPMPEVPKFAEIPRIKPDAEPDAESDAAAGANAGNRAQGGTQGAGTA